MQHLNKNLQLPCTHKLSIPREFQTYPQILRATEEVFSGPCHERVFMQQLSNTLVRCFLEDP